MCRDKKYWLRLPAETWLERKYSCARVGWKLKVFGRRFGSIALVLRGGLFFFFFLQRKGSNEAGETYVRFFGDLGEMGNVAALVGEGLLISCGGEGELQDGSLRFQSNQSFNHGTTDCRSSFSTERMQKVGLLRFG